MCKVGRHLDENGDMMPLLPEVQTASASVVVLIRYGCEIFKYHFSPQ